MIILAVIAVLTFVIFLCIVVSSNKRAPQPMRVVEEKEVVDYKARILATVKKGDVFYLTAVYRYVEILDLKDDMVVYRMTFDQRKDLFGSNASFGERRYARDSYKMIYHKKMRHRTKKDSLSPELKKKLKQVF